MFDRIIDLLSRVEIKMVLLIFFARIIEVSLGTLRVIFISKGYRKQGVVLAFIEVTIWVFVASKVMAEISTQPFYAIIYSLGFASGVYVGSKIEERLAFGKVIIQAITTLDNGPSIATALREHGHGVTTMSGQGKDSEKAILMIFANRRGKEGIVDVISDIDSNAIVVTNELNYLKGGYISKWKRFFK